MKKTLPIVAATLLFASHVLFGQSSTDAPTNSTDKHAAHLQNKLLKEEDKNAAYFKFEYGIFITRISVLSLQAGTPDGDAPRCLGNDALNAFTAVLQDRTCADLSNPKDISALYDDMVVFQQAFLKQNISHASEFIPLCDSSVNTLSAILNILQSIPNKSDFAPITTAFSKIDANNQTAQAIAELSIFDYIQAYIAHGGSEHKEVKMLPTEVPGTGAPLDLLSWQTQVVQYASAFPAKCCH